MPDKNLKGPELPTAGTSRTPSSHDKHSPSRHTRADDAHQEKKGQKRSSKSAAPRKATTRPETSQGATRSDGVKNSLGVEARDGVGNPMIQVTRASYINEGKAVPARVESATAATEAAVTSPVERPVHESLMDVADSSSSIQIQQQQQRLRRHRPLFPGAALVFLGAIMACVGVLFLAMDFPIVGWSLAMFGAILLLCGGIYLAQCFVERCVAKRQKKLREATHRQSHLEPGRTSLAPTRGGGLGPRPAKSMAEISNASEERVETITDLSASTTELLKRSQRDSVSKSFPKTTFVRSNSAKT